MRVLSTFSGISAASVAWKPLGWEMAGYCEPSAFQASVLNQRLGASRPIYTANGFKEKDYKNIPVEGVVPNFGDITQITDRDLEKLGEVKILEGGSPCFPAGTYITTERGIVNIEDVVVGDMVITHKKRFRKVLKVGGKMSKTVLVKGYGHHGLTTTEEHPFYARKREKDGSFSDASWVEAKDLKGFNWSSVAEFPETQVPAISKTGRERICPDISDDLMWLVGAYLGDGWIRSDRTPVLMYGVNERKLDQIRERVERAGLSMTENVERTSIKVAVGSSAFARWIMENFGKGAGEKSIPVWAFGMKESYRRNLLEGYCAMDGCTSKRDGNIQIKTISRKLAFTTKMLANSLGYGFSMSYSKPTRECFIEGRKVNERPYYAMAISESKRSSFEIDGLRYGRVRSVKHSDEEVMVYNLEVEEDNSYVADSIVVHNCQSFSMAGMRGGLSDSRGNLALAFAQLVQRMRKINGLQYVIYENVPGLLNHPDNPLGCLMASLAGDEAPLLAPGNKWPNAGHVASTDVTIAWRLLDAKYQHLGQRRKRCFLVASFDNDIDSGEVLFEPIGEGWSAQENLAAWENITGHRKEGSRGIAAILLMDSGVSRQVYPDVAYALTVQQGHDPQVVIHPKVVPTLMASGAGLDRTASMGSEVDYVIIHPDESVGTLMTSSGGTKQIDIEHVVVSEGKTGMMARRLMPIETERLQGFPDGWTDVTFKGKPAIDLHRYRACGNSMAVTCMNWIGRRLEFVINKNKSSS